MFRTLYNKVETAYNKKIDGIGLDLFRICYSTVLLCEVIQLYYFRHLIYDKIPYIEPSEVNFGPAIILWALILILQILGAFTKITTIVNYVFSLVFFSTLNTYEYHMVYIYMSTNFVLMFLSVSNCISIDRYLIKLKFKAGELKEIPDINVSQLQYFIPVFISLGLVYFNSTFFKLGSPTWLNGYGLWLPSSLPMFVHADVSFLLNQKWISLFLGYLTLIFEISFIFLFWFKRFRVLLAVIGIGLHIGILIIYPIPWFAFGVLFHYILLIPIHYWKFLYNPPKYPIAKSHNLLKNRTNIKLICLFFIVISLIQLLFSYESAIGKGVRRVTGFKNSKLDVSISSTLKTILKPAIVYMGITNHPVFMDNHFRNYNHILRIGFITEDKIDYLPIIKKNGMPSYYLNGTNWVKWSFRVNAPNFNKEGFKKGVRDFTAFWAYKNHVSLNNASFVVELKKIDIPQHWQKNFLREQMAHPWTKIGTVTWIDNNCNVDVPDIESL